jgi:hypothetical protein
MRNIALLLLLSVLSAKVVSAAVPSCPQISDLGSFIRAARTAVWDQSKTRKTFIFNKLRWFMEEGHWNQITAAGMGTTAKGTITKISSNGGEVEGNKRRCFYKGWKAAIYADELFEFRMTTLI